MAINFLNYAGIKPISMSDLTEPYRENRSFIEQQKRAALERAMLEQKNQYLPRQLEAEIGMTEAQAENERMFGAGKHLTGVASNVFALNQLKNMYGEDSPVYQDARKAFDLQNAHTQSNIDTAAFYRAHPERFLTPTGKGIQEQYQASQGNVLGIDRKLTPAESAAVVRIQERNRVNANNPAAMQQSALAAEQVAKTFSMIDKKALSQYSGPEGKKKYLEDRALELQGKAPERYKQYQENLSRVHSLKPQLTAYYGLSITKSQQDDLESLINPNSWVNSPDTTLRKLNAVEGLFNEEHKITKSALGSGEIYGQTPLFGNPGYGDKSEPPGNPSYPKIGTPVGQSSTNEQERASQLQTYILEQSKKGRAAVTNGKKIEFIPIKDLTEYLLKNRGSSLYGQ